MAYSNNEGSTRQLGKAFRIAAIAAPVVALALFLGTKTPQAVANAKAHQDAANLATCKQQYQDNAARKGGEVSVANVAAITVQGPDCVAPDGTWNFRDVAAGL